MRTGSRFLQIPRIDMSSSWPIRRKKRNILDASSASDRSRSLGLTFQSAAGVVVPGPFGVNEIDIANLSTCHALGDEDHSSPLSDVAQFTAGTCILFLQNPFTQT